MAVFVILPIKYKFDVDADDNDDNDDGNIWWSTLMLPSIRPTQTSPPSSVYLIVMYLITLLVSAVVLSGVLSL